MPGKFYPVSLKHLLQLIFDEFVSKKSIFGIPEELFFDPERNYHLKTELFNHELHTPVGVAAGPHTQMAQNIIGSWLMGARYIELKTIQTLDDLEVSKPCIDMQDEGYNCEWSQELNIRESFNEYLNAWIIIHILNHRFGRGTETGTIFNMSLGYNMEGILKENVQWFLKKMTGCHDELISKIAEIQEIYPLVKEIVIPSIISDNITLSTMHGCPANEIEEIAGYFLEEKNLHTFVKLNPTLLGPVILREILTDKLNFKTNVPDNAFVHDLKYPDAIKIIKSLQKKAKRKNLRFGLKLTNTLESVNNKGIFKPDVEMMYMSGRSLHPISVNLAKKLRKDFKTELLLSFSAGADAFNIASLIACGFKTVTTCSDILKPGGYMRLNQYFENLKIAFLAIGAANIDEFILKSSGNKLLNEAAFNNLNSYAGEVLVSDYYKRKYIRIPDTKTDRELGYFDCISAPCRDTCSTNQDVPDYLYFTSTGQSHRAFEVILKTNPFPSVTGMICDHLCQGKCTRINYDDPLRIREVKRFISEQNEPELKPAVKIGIKVAIIGAGPTGLSCAYYLSLAGFAVDVFEVKSKAGGMVQYAIPGFRLTDNAIDKDLKRIKDAGVNIHYNSKIDKVKFGILKKEYHYIYIAAGAQLSARLDVSGSDANGVIEPLNFLFDVKQGNKTGIGNNVVIIGGGNTAMDAARTAYRLVGNDGRVTVVYRRTKNEMPADNGEIKAVLDEGMEILELAAPERIIHENGRVKGLICSKMELKGVDNRGRSLPVKVKDSEFEILCDTIIPAIGQNRDIDFAEDEQTVADKITYTTRNANVFIGGDALRSASTAINAIGDGRKVAEQMIRQSVPGFISSKHINGKSHSKKELIIKRSQRQFSKEPIELPLNDRKNFKLVNEPSDRETIVEEAGRCLYCDEICNICTTVCPNFANYSYEVDPVRYVMQTAQILDNGTIEIHDDKVFEVKQIYQILNIANFCNKCGNCNTFCPSKSAPYIEKPRFYLTISSFNSVNEGYFMSRLKDRKNLIFKKDGSIATLTELPDEYIYETDYVFGRFSKNEFKLLEVKFKTPCVKEIHFDHAADMSILLKGADNLVFE
jgi:putative selenate reductase